MEDSGTRSGGAPARRAPARADEILFYLNSGLLRQRTWNAADLGGRHAAGRPGPLPDGPPPVLAIERAAPAAGGRPRRLERGDRAAARAHAGRACALYRSPESLVTLAVAVLATGDFPAALRLWREIRAGSGPSARQ